MKKLIITENQLSNIQKHLNEQENDNSFYEKVKCAFHIGNDTTIENFEIEDIEPLNIPLKFDIDIINKNYGIVGANIFNVRGPKDVNIVIHYYNEDKNISEEYNYDLKLNWSPDIIRKENINTLPHIGIDNEIDIHLNKDGDELKVEKIFLKIREI